MYQSRAEDKKKIKHLEVEVSNKNDELKNARKNSEMNLNKAEKKIYEMQETANWAVECQNNEIKNKTYSLKEAYQELNTLGKLKDILENEKDGLKKENDALQKEKEYFRNQNTSLRDGIKQLEEDNALDQEAAVEVVAELNVKIKKLEKQILSK